MSLELHPRVETPASSPPRISTFSAPVYDIAGHDAPRSQRGAMSNDAGWRGNGRLWSNAVGFIIWSGILLRIVSSQELAGAFQNTKACMVSSPTCKSNFNSVTSCGKWNVFWRRWLMEKGSSGLLGRKGVHARGMGSVSR